MLKFADYYKTVEGQEVLSERPESYMFITMTIASKGMSGNLKLPLTRRITQMSPSSKSMKSLGNIFEHETPIRSVRPRHIRETGVSPFSKYGNVPLGQGLSDNYCGNGMQCGSFPLSVERSYPFTN